MAELEAELKAERSRLRALTAEQTKAQREKEAVLLDLRRTESVSRRDFTHGILTNKHPIGHDRCARAATANQAGES